MDEAKRNFLEHEFVELLMDLRPMAKGKWGVMNGQQMVEHMSEAFRNASGKLVQPMVTPPEKLESYKAFAMSDKPFKENTKNSLMKDTPPELTCRNMTTALNELASEIKYFFEVYDANPSLTNKNPFFGELNFSEQVALLYKHAVHHARQFELME